MIEILYATGNKIKFQLAHEICNKFEITLTQHGLDVPEIQGEDGEAIAMDKAAKAYAKFQKPLVISDDNWIIPGLNGFPGPYMKSMNDWFTADDWLRLTRQLSDRRIILRQICVYQDGDNQHVFTYDMEGLLLTDARGVSPHPHSAITSFDGGKHSNAEFHEQSKSAASHRQTAWHDFAEWYRKSHDRQA
jgi:XTP/dITP diphosphohydrolase